MSAPHTILDCLLSFCQKLADLVEVWRSYNENNFACFFLRHGVYIVSGLIYSDDVNSAPPSTPRLVPSLITIVGHTVRHQH